MEVNIVLFYQRMEAKEKMKDGKYFIAVEGLDGVGKTTCARLLAKDINGYYYKTPSGLFQEIRGKIDILDNPQVRFTFYLSSVFYASAEISSLLDEKSVVCDRYIYSTIAYHKALGVNLSYIDFGKLPILLPNVSFYLWAEEKAYLQRLLKRNDYSVSDYNIEKNRTLQQKIHQEFLTLPIIPLDTSNLKPEEVCVEVLHEINI